MVKDNRPREEIAYEKFLDESYKTLQLNFGDNEVNDEADFKNFFNEEPQKTVFTQALNNFLWEQDKILTDTIKQTYENLSDLIKKQIPESDRGEETGRILQIIDELREAEDTDEELLSAEELKELTKDDE